MHKQPAAKLASSILHLDSVVLFEGFYNPAVTYYNNIIL